MRADFAALRVAVSVRWVTHVVAIQPPACGLIGSTTVAAEQQIVRGVLRRVQPPGGSGGDLAGAAQPLELEATGV